MKAEVLFRKSISIFTIIALLMAEFVVIGQNIVNAMTNEELEIKAILQMYQMYILMHTLEMEKILHIPKKVI